jgi:LPS sulfotransferase NodH
VFDHPRIAEWLRELLHRRDTGAPITAPYIARMLRRGAEVEGLKLKGPITDTNVARYIRDRGKSGQEV